MMIIVRLVFVVIILCYLVIANADNNTCGDNRYKNNNIDDLAITTDNRIKTYIHNRNEVYLLVLHFGFQSSIELAEHEEVNNIVLGDSYAWKITVIGHRIFIKPLEKNIRTNMTILTNKRIYQFDVVSKELEEGHEKDLVYVIRFYYPKSKNPFSIQ